MTEETRTKSKRAETSAGVARAAAERAGKAAEANPLAVVAGGIALGVVAGALLPRTRRETELLGPVGKRVKDVATGAAEAAKVAAAAELASLPLSKSAAREQVGKIVDQVGKALASAGAAALSHTDQAKPIKTVKASAKKAKYAFNAASQHAKDGV